MKTAKSARDLTSDRHITLEMPVIRFKDHECSAHNWTTKQIFEEIRKLTGAPEEGAQLASSMKALHVRDLRLIDPHNSVNCQPMIMVRERGIIVKLEHVRGVILHDGVLLIESQARAVPVTGSVNAARTRRSPVTNRITPRTLIT